jgi:hypothetical protein
MHGNRVRTDLRIGADNKLYSKHQTVEKGYKPSIELTLMSSFTKADESKEETQV